MLVFESKSRVEIACHEELAPAGWCLALQRSCHQAKAEVRCVLIFATGTLPAENGAATDSRNLPFVCVRERTAGAFAQWLKAK